jgi:hypothetical protein
MSQAQIIAQVEVAAVVAAKRGRPANTAVQAICQAVVASAKSYRYVADLVRHAKAQMGNMVVSDATIRKYILLAMEGAAKKIKKELTAEEKAVNTIINLQVGNVVRSGKTNINEVAFALSQKMAEKGINRNKSQVVRLLKKKEMQIAKDRTNGVLGKNGKIPAEMGLTRNPVGRPKKK